jgi:hypothetical protein
MKPRCEGRVAKPADRYARGAHECKHPPTLFCPISKTRTCGQHRTPYSRPQQEGDVSAREALWADNKGEPRAASTRTACDALGDGVGASEGTGVWLAAIGLVGDAA